MCTFPGIQIYRGIEEQVLGFLDGPLKPERICMGIFILAGWAEGIFNKHTLGPIDKGAQPTCDFGIK